MSTEDKFKTWVKQATGNDPYPFQIRFACDPALPALVGQVVERKGSRSRGVSDPEHLRMRVADYAGT